MCMGGERVDTLLQSDKVWLVVRSLRDCGGVRLSEGDVLKLGRFRLKVKEAVLNQQQALLATARQRPHLGDADDCETVAPEPESAAVAAAAVDMGFEFGEGGGLVPLLPLKKNSRPLSRCVSEGCLLTPKGSGAGAELFYEGGESASHSFDGAASMSIRPLSAADARASRSSLFSRPACRICLCEAAEDEDPDANPLVAPCRCKGSMQFVHLQCLRTWMEGRLNIRNDGSTVGYFLRSLDCELCKAPYPSLVEANRKVIELFAIPRPQYPYFILEPRTTQPAPAGATARVRGLHVVSLSNRRVARLGRGHDSDVRLSDISVSRFHAIIRHQQVAFKGAG
ncbi:forkhead-aasociated domain-containing protein [Cyclospora cayetanensis]|uniref:Forkhead-aasociated domain-containing protein n=1 Tax=Cyclospora cayetanensis TaxID=88456 RepID=A0A1D3CW25_9EIME|nr:forkhead-aasociated domain-containing protein [Cyclospora cayetanensis]